MMNRNDIVRAILEEIQSQEDKWGKNEDRDTTRYEFVTILVEETGEVARAVLQHANNTHKSEHHSYHKELVQVAAVTISAIEVDMNNQEIESK